MVFNIFKFTTLLALPILAVATPWAVPTTTTKPPVTTTITVTTTPSATPGSSCSTGSLQCCESSSSASDPSTAALLGLLGIVVQGVDVLVGLTCSPITVIGISDGSCTAQTVCCENDSFNGLVAIGCSPITL